MKSLQYETKAIDVSKEKGIVTVAVNGIDIEDAQHDISQPGSFVNTLKNDMPRMRWFLNHDVRQLLGVPLSGEEKDGNVIMTGQLNLNKQIGRDILTDYMLYQEAGRTLEHSIGVQAVKRDTADKRKVIEWRMLEYSTLTGWGANPNTYLVGLKSGTAERVREAADFIRLALKQHGYSDERLKTYDMQLDLCLKALSGGTVVTCPCCGHQFDYDSQPEHTFSAEVCDAAGDWLHWATQNIVYQEMEKLKPEIREQVVSIIDSLKGSKEELTQKSITDSLAFVRCPNCYKRVYRGNSLITPESTEEPTEESEIVKNDTEGQPASEQTIQKSTETPAPKPSFWAQLNETLNH